jgi:hypothetical protein
LSNRLRSIHKKTIVDIKIWKEKEEDFFYGSNSIDAVDVAPSFSNHQFFWPLGHAAGDVGTVKPPVYDALTSNEPSVAMKLLVPNSVIVPKAFTTVNAVGSLLPSGYVMCRIRATVPPGSQPVVVPVIY